MHSVQATIDFSPEASYKPAAGGLRINLAGGSSSQTDLRTVLHRRLRFAATLTLGVYLFFVALWAHAEGYRVWEYSWIGIVFLILIHGTFVAELAATLILWFRPPTTLRGLRWIEALVVISPVLHLLWYDAWPLFFRDLLELSFTTVQGSHDISRVRVFTWFVIIITYGVLIPNTWRRAFLILSALSILAFGINLSAAIWHGVLGQPKIVMYLTEMVIWLAFATGVVVFNAYRIDVLGAASATARQLGQYRLGRRLGAGGMGEVYLAEHMLLRRPCALKLIRAERAGDLGTLLRFEREVQVTATLTHPNTIQVFDYGRADDGTFYYVMEFLPGLTLDDLIERHGVLTPARAIHLLRQICGALREAHSVGLIHRDIKPGNVIVCERGGVGDVAKVLDFGLVRTTASQADEVNLTQEGAVTGTPAFMSPEQATARGNLDARSDIYSVGALAYYLLAGRAPFAGRSAALVIAAHVYEAPAPLSTHRPDMPADLEAVILRCLAKDPGERFPDAASLEAALEGCQGAGQWTGTDAVEWWRTNRMLKVAVASEEASRNLV